MSLRIAVARRNEALDAIRDNANSGILRIYTGARPATPETAASGTLLAELTLNATAFGAAASGVLTANSITRDSSANAGGTAGWFRIWESDGTTPWADGECGATGSGKELELVTTTITASQPVEISSLTVSWPNV
jgi:hypothetical protein